MIALVVVMIDKGFDLGFEIARQKVIFLQNPVPQCLMPALNFALGLGMIRRSARLLHAFALQLFGQISRDVTGAIVAEKARGLWTTRT